MLTKLLVLISLTLGGKWLEQSHVHIEYVQIPWDFVELHKYVTLVADVMFVNGLPFLIDRNCDLLPKTSNIHSRRMVLLHGGGADDNGKRRERASDDGAA